MILAREEIINNTKVFKTLLNSTGKFYFSIYNEDMVLVESDVPNIALNIAFEISGCKSYLETYAKESSDPIVLWAAFGMMWICVFEPGDNGFECVYVVGPMHNVETSISTAESELKKIPISIEQKRVCLDYLNKLPLASSINIFPYAVMLHKCVTGDTISRNRVQLQHLLDSNHSEKRDVNTRGRQYSVYAEHMLLDKVRQGNLNFESDLEKVVSVETGVRINVGDVLKRTQVNMISFTTLCSRAAIEGGLPPDIAYELAETYIQSAMVECKTLGDIQCIVRQMYKDFIERVNEIRKKDSLSMPIRSCCSYIEENVEKNLDIKELAARAGYAEYYLSRKFNEEVGMTITDFIKQARINQGKKLLAYSKLSIQQISEKLNFCSRSYFTKIFKEMVGITPGKYREENQCL